jgi:integrase/recombinase XerD
MSPAAPVITIFVRHSSDCKYAGDEFAKACRCRKHFRWSQNGSQLRRKAGTRSWAEAEKLKRDLEDHLSGRTPDKTAESKTLDEAVKVFQADKKNQGISPDVLNKYSRELERLKVFCVKRGAYTVQGITREMLTDFAGTWEEAYPSSTTRAKVRERLRSFLRYCYEAQWLPRIPQVPKIKIDEPPTMPLTAEEYKRLLNAVYAVEARWSDGTRRKIHALFQLMRWSGLAIQDALTLERGELQHDKGGLYRIATSRQKTGVYVSVPIPAPVAKELLAVLNGNAKYFFWTGEGDPKTLTNDYGRYIRPIFEAAGLNGGHMKSHRLRDTFAVDLLEKGVPLEEVSKLLGHESIKTTERHYAKWVQGRQDRLDSLVTGTWD